MNLQIIIDLFIYMYVHYYVTHISLEIVHCLLPKENMIIHTICLVQYLQTEGLLSMYTSILTDRVKAPSFSVSWHTAK